MQCIQKIFAFPPYCFSETGLESTWIYHKCSWLNMIWRVHVTAPTKPEVKRICSSRLGLFLELAAANHISRTVHLSDLPFVRPHISLTTCPLVRPPMKIIFRVSVMVRIRIREGVTNMQFVGLIGGQTNGSFDTSLQSVGNYCQTIDFKNSQPDLK